MKRIAFFVEGKTEQLFINKLLIEIAGQKNIAINLFQIRGGTRIPTQQIFVPQTATYSHPVSPQFEALIYDCGSDNKVKSDILDNIQSLSVNGYSEIIGVRDLYPLPFADLASLENGLKFIPPSSQPLPIPFTIIIAVNEIEAWFLAECNHYKCIDNRLTNTHIQKNIGFDPCNDDMTLLTHPSENLRNIYQLVGKTYSKNKKHVERTVECLDYANLYLNVSPNISKLNSLITRIDNFLT
jgi:Domain of unknown function (DUF4276)